MTASLHEQVAIRRHGGQSVYAPPGERSAAQKQHDLRGLMDLIERVSFAAGRAEGFEAGHRAGRRYAYRTVGLRHLADAIERDLAALRREVAA
jgi:hypothetical protein